MTLRQLADRQRFCLENHLCFISLRPLEKEDTLFEPYHETLGFHVGVKKEYLED